MHGDADTDPAFSGGGRSDPLLRRDGRCAGAVQRRSRLWYQPVAYRWAVSLKGYDAPEPKRFVSFYEDMSAGSGVMLARAAASAK